MSCFIDYFHKMLLHISTSGLFISHTYNNCSSYYSIAVKRHHDQGNSYQKKYLIGGLLTVSEFHSQCHGKVPVSMGSARALIETLHPDLLAEKERERENF